MGVVSRRMRAVLGETGDTTDMVVELFCNVDDMTGEAIGFRFLAGASGSIARLRMTSAGAAAQAQPRHATVGMDGEAGGESGQHACAVEG